MPNRPHRLDRRSFLAGLAGIAGFATLMPRLHAAEAAPAATVAAGPQVRIGLVGCGKRGSWIAKLFQEHGGFTVAGVADYFPEVATRVGKSLGVAPERCFSGLHGYQRLIASGIDALVIKDVPYFYPEQAAAAVQAGCHVYLAKPIAVDVPGCLAIAAAGGAAGSSWWTTRSPTTR